MNELPGWFLSPRHRPRRADARLAARVEMGNPDEVGKRTRMAADIGLEWVQIHCDGSDASALNAACVAARGAGAPPISVETGADPLTTSDADFRSLCQASAGIQWIVVSSGQPAASVATPAERGRSFETLDRWRDTARKAGMSLAVTGGPGSVLGTTVSCERFAQERWGQGTALALDPGHWLAGTEGDERTILDLVLGLAPWSLVLYLGQESDTGVRIESAVRALRASGVPPCIVLCGDDMEAARNETRAAFEELGLPLDRKDSRGG